MYLTLVCRCVGLTSPPAGGRPPKRYQIVINKQACRAVFVGGMCQVGTNQKGYIMIDYDDDVEVITKNKCVECGDKLTPYETLVCIICEAVNE